MKSLAGHDLSRGHALASMASGGRRGIHRRGRRGAALAKRRGSLGESPSERRARHRGQRRQLLETPVARRVAQDRLRRARQPLIADRAQQPGRQPVETEAARRTKKSPEHCRVRGSLECSDALCRHCQIPSRLLLSGGIAASCGRILRTSRMDFEFGRRDWTRTNDPHHVKVVL